MSVAVVIATIPGREAMLERALASVDTQRLKPDQVIVELDAERTGAAATRNRALAKVETDYVAWLDDDDELLPGHLKALCTYIGDWDLAYPRPEVVGGTEPTAVTVKGRWVKPWGVTFGEEQRNHIITKGSFIPITHLVRTDSVRRIGGFPESQTLPTGRFQGEDERYLIALLQDGCRFVHINITTWRWHVHNAHTAGKGQ